MSALSFAEELRQKIESLGGDIKNTDPDPIKRAKSVAFLYAVVSETMHKIKADDAGKARALEALRSSYNELISAVFK